METWNKKKKKRGRRSREGIINGAPADQDDDVEKIESLTMMSKSKKLLGCHLEYSTKEEEQNKVGVVGVFDFPWLRDQEGEGMIFKEGVGDDYLCEPAGAGLMGILEEEDDEYHTFALFHDSISDHLHFTTTTTTTSTSTSSLPLLFHHGHDHPIPNKVVTLQDKQPPTSGATNLSSSFNNNKVDDHDHSTHNVDDHQMDCIWSSVLDHPLDINLNII